MQYDSDDNHSGQSVLLNWYGGRCLIRPTTTTTVLEKPVWRDTTRYTLRVNDFASGFERVETDENVPVITYTTNRTFCEWFGYDYDATTGSCTLDDGYRYASALLGSYLVRLVRIYIIERADIFSAKQVVEGLPVPPAVSDKYYVKAWKTDVETAFVLPSVEATPTDVTVKRKRREESVGGDRKRVKRDDADEYETQKAERESFARTRTAARNERRAGRPGVGDAYDDLLKQILESSASTVENLVKQMCSKILSFFANIPTNGLSDLVSVGEFLSKLFKMFLTGLFTVNGVMALSPFLFQKISKYVIYFT